VSGRAICADGSAGLDGRVPRYRSSQAYALSERAGRWLSSVVVAFFTRVDRTVPDSLAGRAASSVVGAWLKAAAESVFVRAFRPVARMAFAPHGVPVTVDTALGLAVAVACVAPTEIVFAVGAGALALFLWDRTKHAGDNGKLWAYPGFGSVMAVFAVFLFLVGSTVSSVDPARSLYNLVIWCFYLLFFFLAADSSLRGRAENMVWPFLTGATLAGLVGIYQKLTGWRPAKSWLDKTFEDEIVRMVGTFSNPTFFAEMLGLALPLTLALLLRNKDWRDRLILMGFAAVQGLAMVLTYSRGAWLGLIVSFCVVAVLYERRLLLLGMALAVVVFAVAPDVLLGRLVSSFSLTDSSNNYRLFIWRGSIAMMKANLIRGVGLGAESFSKVYPEYMIVQTPAPHAHSTYMEVLIETGLFGFLAMAWFFVTWAFDSLRAVFSGKGPGSSRWAEIGILAGVVGAVGGHMLQGVIEYTWYSPRVTIVFWALAGMGAGLAATKRSAEVGVQ